jgi:hypothetical protein
LSGAGLFPTDDDVNELLQFMDTDISGRIELGELMTNMAVQVRTGYDGTDWTGKFRLGKKCLTEREMTGRT